MAPPPAQPAAPAPAPKKGSNTLVWILAGCGGLIVIVGIIFAGLTYWGYHKAKGYVDIAKKNPAVAAAKFAVAVNPDLEIVSEDDEAGTLTIRNKKTGEEITMNAEDIKQGRLKFKNEKGEEVTFEGSGKEGKEGFKVKTNKGTMTFGSADGEAPPSWVPAYPGAKVMMSSRGKTGEGFTGTYSFQTADSTEAVLGHYEKELKRARFDVERTAMGAMGNLSAKGDGGKRTVNITAIPLDKLTQVTVAYEATGDGGE
jgi:archaellum component FlaG (FlaF/FlaG flagellin family)